MCVEGGSLPACIMEDFVGYLSSKRGEWEGGGGGGGWISICCWEGRELVQLHSKRSVGIGVVKLELTN